MRNGTGAVIASPGSCPALRLGQVVVRLFGRQTCLFDQNLKVDIFLRMMFYFGFIVGTMQGLTHFHVCCSFAREEWGKYADPRQSGYLIKARSFNIPCNICFMFYPWVSRKFIKGFLSSLWLM